MVAHECVLGDSHNPGTTLEASADSVSVSDQSGGSEVNLYNLDKVCNFCHKKGHWKAACYALKAKSRQNSFCLD